MTDRTFEASTRLRARIAGVFYLTQFLAFVPGAFVSGRLVVSGDAAATASNMLAHEPLFRLGFAGDLIAAPCYIAVTLLFYNLFKPVNRRLSLLAAFFSLVVWRPPPFRRFKSLQYLRPPFVYRNGWMSRRASPR